MTQAAQVIAVLENLGIARLPDLYREVDTSNWKAKDPQANIRRIVQLDKHIAKLLPGLYCLASRTGNYPEYTDTRQKETTEHSYYQGLVVENGKNRGYYTYLPPQDKNKKFVRSALGEICDTSNLPKFSCDKILQQAKTVDVIWFNERKMPAAFYEVECSTSIGRSLEKFHALQDFHADLVIVSRENHYALFENRISNSAFADISKRVQFKSFEEIYKEIKEIRDKTSDLTDFKP